MAKDEHLHVITAFQKYVRGGNKSSIEKFSELEIRQALANCMIADQRAMWYQEMERRMVELRDAEAKKQDTKDRWKEKWADRLIGFAFGIISTLLAAFLKNKLKIGS